MVEALALLDRALNGTGIESVRTSKLAITRVQYSYFAKLALWDLIEPGEESGEAKRGLWKVTRLGIGFLHHGLLVPPVVLSYRGHRTGYEGEPIGVDRYLPTRFEGKQNLLRNAEAGLTLGGM